MTLLELAVSSLRGGSASPLNIVVFVALLGTFAWFLACNVSRWAPAKNVTAVPRNSKYGEKRRNDSSTSASSGDTPEGFETMGHIEPLKNLDFKAERPERIYKFADKYNLTMGLRKTTINTITRIDQQYTERIEERKRILEQYPGALGCVPSGEAMVRELYVFLLTHYLPQRYPTVFVLGESEGNGQEDKAATFLHNRILDERLPLEPPSDIVAALRIIALTVDEDFLMLQPDADGDGYALNAFVWLYPVGFDPVEKLGIKLRDAHAPVPGYKQHLQRSMDRYFERLAPGSVVDRINWAVATNSDLCERGEYHLYGDDQESKTSAADVNIDDTWVRCELQTLFALPRNDARILSVHLYLYPIREIKQVGLAEVMERAIDGYGKGNVPGFARYKRIPVWGEAVKAYLRSEEDQPQAYADKQEVLNESDAANAEDSG